MLKFLKNEIKEKLENTSIHALPHIIRSKYDFIKILWTIFLIISSCVCSYSIHSTVTEYFNYPVVTNIKELNENPMRFPIISLCDINFLNHRRYPLNFSDISNQYNSVSNIISSDKMTFEEQNSLRVKYLFLQYIAASKSSSSERFNSNYINENPYRNLLSCLFNLAPCDISDFDYYFDLRYGYCMRFNNLADDKIKNSTQRGSREGLQLELWIDSSNNDFVLEHGFKVMISYKTIDSNIEEGIKITPGRSNDIILNKYSITKLPYPYNKCIEQLEKIDDYDSLHYRITLREKVSYSYEYCLYICSQEYLGLHCGCEAMGFPAFNNSIPRCEKTKEYTCIINAYQEFLKKGLHSLCDCPTECAKISYSHSVSSSEFPTQSYANILAKNLQIKSKYSPNETITREKLQKNVAMINIFFDQFNHVMIKEEPKMKIPDLVSNIGGTLGLFLGMSFLSFIEIFELILEVFINIAKFLGQNQTAKVSHQDVIEAREIDSILRRNFNINENLSLAIYND